MAKRGKLEIVRDILQIIQDNGNSMKLTPLIRKSNLSSQSFSEYVKELTEKEFIKINNDKKGRKSVSVTERGMRYLMKYKNIVSFIEEFEL